MRKRDRGAAGCILREWRERRGYTQEELARRSRVGVVSIGALERGEDWSAGEELARICIALEVEPEMLLTEIAQAEADELEPLVEKIRRERGQEQESRRSAERTAESDLFLLAARFAHRSGNLGSLDAMVKLISKVNLSTPIVGSQEHAADPG